MEKGRKMMIIIILLLVILLGAIVGAAIFIVGELNRQATESEAEFVPGGESLQELTVEEIMVFNLATGLSTNLLSEDPNDEVQHGIRVQFSIGIDARDTAAATAIFDQMTEKEVIVRDIILAILRDTTYEFYIDPDSIEVLSDTILVALQNSFGSNLIYDVYYYDIATS